MITLIFFSKCMDCVDVKQVINIFVMHACKIVDFTGIHLNFSLFYYTCFTGFNKIFHLCEYRGIYHYSSPNFQDVVNVLVGRCGCSLKAGVSTMATNLPSTFKSANVQASHFSVYNDRCLIKEIRFSLYL